MTYKECLAYLYEQLPIYQRIGAAAYRADLKNTIALLTILGNPQRNFKTIHIAGTNGKGSVSHMLSSILQEAGLKVGLYTSPHLSDFRERVKLNGQMIPEQRVVEFIESHLPEVEEISPSFFEWTVALAFDYFSEQHVDIAVIETGLGGRLDSTNVITPEVSVITNIGHDHMRFLGNRLEHIAMEKAGIIKKNVPVVIGMAVPEIRKVFSEVALSQTAPIIYAEDKDLKSYEMDIKGLYQLENQRTVLTALEVLLSRGFNLTEKTVQDGFKNVLSNTGLKGRWQILAESPRIIADLAHNKEGVLAMLKTLENEKFDDLHVVWGTVDDKDAGDILGLMPVTATYYFCCPDVPRGLDVFKLYKTALELGLTGKPFDSVSDALNAAKSVAENDDLIFVGGSTFVVAEVV